jgi:hypothetical protein
MEHVLKIVQAALPDGSTEDTEDIEIPLDALDSFTLRQLQKYIEVFF